MNNIDDDFDTWWVICGALIGPYLEYVVHFAVNNDPYVHDC